MARTFVMGDIHGAHRALVQCLHRANFNPEVDTLICLGDVVDGWPDARQCIDELAAIKHLVYLWGNHDLWAYAWMKEGILDESWLWQGGRATITSFGDGPDEKHLRFFEKAKPYHLLNNTLFVHGGVLQDQPLHEQGLPVFAWDRSLAQEARRRVEHGESSKITPFDEVYIGHTPIPDKLPRQFCEVWMMDTGAGWSGVLSMMDIHSKEVYTSDPVPSLYPGFPGRLKR
jgi:predicted phosphodiesterase